MTPTPTPEVTEAMLIAARDWSAAKYGKPIGDDAARGCFAAMTAAQPIVAPSDLSGEDGLSKTIPTEQAGDASGLVVTDAQIEAVHEALGGNGWAYSNYGQNELRSHREDMERVVRALAALKPSA